MAHVLVLFAHPRTDRSVANTALVAAARAMEGVELIDLYGEYPDFDIDIDREQQRLIAADCVVLQHPVYWYSCPALMKEWQDLVLEYDFAYGSEGTALVDKPLLQIATCGTAREAYRKKGKYENELRTLFSPFEQTAKFCGMRYLAPFGVFSAEDAAEEGRLDAIVADYRRLLSALRDGTLDLEKAEAAVLLNDALDEAIASEAAAE
ncbi:MAG: NAD(P)H-dependent oxidoreductase [Nisaea sp.]|jgi:putative NADPH-quinone reductase|uniref:NAD(P)H-dependent oxidoreductase n=1 Tax=Nisaea sp. TaxID=2024842 RepID=UPI001B275269|nr:NAD(P)H-dependent oxidoreductase [Nisaea sp.]MBO6560382.1 NAD(P)H-dependent oxidoreductase [Nisaea sp.]